jgi:hypothetical protein
MFPYTMFTLQTSFIVEVTVNSKEEKSFVPIRSKNSASGQPMVQMPPPPPQFVLCKAFIRLFQLRPRIRPQVGSCLMIADSSISFSMSFFLIVILEE